MMLTVGIEQQNEVQRGFRTLIEVRKERCEFERWSRLAKQIRMGNPKLFYYDYNTIRDLLNETRDLSDLIHEKESELVAKLYRIDRQRLFVLYGFKSLTGFCLKHLRFSRTQTQRIVTRVRRFEPTDKIVDVQKMFSPSIYGRLPRE